MVTPTETTLKNGLRVVTIDLPGFHSLTNFLVLRSGSRYENNMNNGVAHFLEHMVFKGTKKYGESKLIAQAIEGVGGYFNAWTANDHTAYWNTVPSRSWQVGIEMPVELAFNALIRSKDIERERGVILEEIRMIHDDPRHFVDDLFGQTLFDSHPLGQFIIGSEQTIEKMQQQDFLAYRSAHYAPSQALFIVVGDLQGKDIIGNIEQLTAHTKPQPVSQPEKFIGYSASKLHLHKKKTDQTHFMLGVACPQFAFGNQEKYVGVLLNTILGRGMSSRLFLNVREKRGLAYSINSSFQSFEDTGVIAIYGGVNTAKVEEALLATNDELRLLQDKLVADDELNRAKELVKGSYDLASDDPIELARWYGGAHLLGERASFEQAQRAIDKVTAVQVRDLARNIFLKSRLGLAVIGPFENDKIFRLFLDS